MPDELLNAFDLEPDFKKAFSALTPERQRGYIIYFSQPKQYESRIRRIEKYEEQIFIGQGMYDG